MTTTNQNIDGFSTALSGLNAQQSKLEMIGNNIANINTIGYKSSRMTFAEQFGSTIGITQTPFNQGAFQSTGIVTDLAIQGNSFFILKDGEDKYFTRDGGFSFENDGTLINGQKFPVQGWTIDPNDSSKKSAEIGDIVIDQNLMSNAKSTNNVWLNGNLNAGLTPAKEEWSSIRALTMMSNGMEEYAVESTEINNLMQISKAFQEEDKLLISGTNREGTEVSSSFIFGESYDGITIQDLMNKIDETFGNQSKVILRDGKIVMTDQETGLSQTSIEITEDTDNIGMGDFPGFANLTSGYIPIVKTSMVVYDSLGQAHELTINLEKTENSGEWKVQVEVNGSETILNGETGMLSFDSNGNFQSFEYEDGSTEFTFDPGTGITPLNVQFNFASENGYSGVTQFESVSSLSMRKQDGIQAGFLTGINVDANGILKGLFSNGEKLDLAQIGTANFTNSNGLEKVAGSLYVETASSGDSSINTADENGSVIESGALEMSNVDLANQFTQMIEAQRGFQATSRVMTTLNEVMDEASRLKR